jgi:hypothetical protein
MKIPARLLIFALLSGVYAIPALAQTADDYHPFLSDRFNIGIGGYWPKIDFAIQVDGSDPNDEIDLDEALNLSDYQSSGVIDFQWRFGEKWLLGAQAWSTSTSGKEQLAEDIEWEDIIFEEGTFVKGGAGLDIARVFVGRNFFTTDPKHSFGAGIGLHWMNLDTFLEGEVLSSEGDLEFERVSASVAFPLPNIGAWYAYSWSPKWMFSTRIDWLSASIGDYSGGLWDANAGFNFQAFEKIGFGFYLQAFSLDVDVDKSDWHGSAKFQQLGPMLTVTATW